MGSTFGHLFRITTWGESHGGGVGVVVDGCPPNLEISCDEIQAELDRRGGWLVFLLRVNPLTSSDLVSYAAGFTRIPIWKVMFATMLGMAPLCFAQAWLAENLFVAYPWLLYPLLGVGIVYVFVIIVVVRRLAK